MFFNAMKRKGWEPKEEDMRAVVGIHNAVNERTWAEVMKWEKMHAAACGNPRLVRFQGRPTDFSPRARLNSLLGYTLPFDRHDWVVDRCGTEVQQTRVAPQQRWLHADSLRVARSAT
jgi:cytochrome c heme-lyase